MTTALLSALGMVPAPRAEPYPVGMDIITDPAKLPADRTAIADDTLIGPPVWAALQGVVVATVYRGNTLANKHRVAGTPKTGDMPKADETVGQTPMWFMSTYRAWEAARPGKGAGAGRPKKPGGPVKRARVSLPLTCPHCKHEIAAEDLKPATASSGKKPASGRPAARKPRQAAKASG